MPASAHRPIVRPHPVRQADSGSCPAEWCRGWRRCRVHVRPWPRGDGSARACGLGDHVFSWRQHECGRCPSPSATGRRASVRLSSTCPKAPTVRLSSAASMPTAPAVSSQRDPAPRAHLQARRRVPAPQPGARSPCSALLAPAQRRPRSAAAAGAGPRQVHERGSPWQPPIAMCASLGQWCVAASLTNATER